MTQQSFPTAIIVNNKTANSENRMESSTEKMLCWWENNWKAMFAEFVATAMLLFFGCMSSCVLPNGLATPPLYAPLGFGLTVAMNIQIFGHISGAHMNPAVTLGAVLWGSMSIPLGIFYLIMQCSGSIVGFGLLTLLMPDIVKPEDMCSSIPRQEISTLQALTLEMFLTATLNFVNCGVWDERNRHLQDSMPIKFGLVIVALSIAGGPMTGASMNPARSLGPALLNGTWKDHWVYWVGPFVGGSISIILYRYIWKPKNNSASPEEQPLDRM